MKRRKRAATTQSEPRFTNANLTLIGFAVLALLGAAQYMSPQSREIRQLKASSRLEDLQSQAEAAKANKRYISACVMPHAYVGIAPNWYPKATVIAEGKPVLTGATQTAVVEGSTVCDDRGHTAIIRNGVPTDSAKSNDAALINQRFEDALGWHPSAQRSDVYVGNK